MGERVTRENCASGGFSPVPDVVLTFLCKSKFCVLGVYSLNTKQYNLNSQMYQCKLVVDALFTGHLVSSYLRLYRILK